MIVTLMILSIVFQETDRPAAPDSGALTRDSEGLRHTTTEDPSGIDRQVMQEQAREEREANEDRAAQGDDHADAAPQRRRQAGQTLRPARRPNPGG